MIIAIASDHAGVELKTALLEPLKKYADTILDLGTNDSKVRVDYVDYINIMAKKILAGEVNFGVAICGSGIGVSIAANRHKGIYAAVCRDGLSASLARQHNNANILCLGARLIGVETAIDCVHHFFTSSFDSGTERYRKRIEKLDA